MVESSTRKIRELFVYMNGSLVGTLLREAASRYIFKYDQHWLEQEGARPVSLSLLLTEAPIQGERVFHFFNNLLPDNDLIRERIQARFKVPTNGCFDLLSYIGKDCVGALQLLTSPLTSNIKQIQSMPLDDRSISELLKHYKTAPLGMDRNSDFRISMAGAQEKTALLWHKNRWCLPLGTTPTSHIFKLPIGRIEHAGIDLSESVENEWLCLQILSAFGLPVNKAEIACFNESKVLVVERFDRRWSKDKKWLMRLPQEDMCQTLGISPALKYESDGGPGIFEIMGLLSGASDAKKNRKQFMKSVFLNWVLGATDGHGKNFSIFIEAGGAYRLTPIYDVISAYPLAEQRQLEWKELKMAMSLKSKNRHYHWNNIQLRHWFSMAEQCKFPKDQMQTIIDEVYDDLENVIDKTKEILPNNFPAHIADPLFNGMRKIKNRLS